MLYSMTGFGKSTCQLPSKKITIEIKSLNSKQLDLNSRAPSAYREAELTWRNILAAKLQRGKVDLSVTVENFGESDLSHLNNDALAAYKRQIEDSAAKLGIDVPADWFSILMRFPEVMVSDKDSQIEPEELASVRAAIESAADALMEYRRVEGIKLEEFFKFDAFDPTVFHQGVGCAFDGGTYACQFFGLDLRVFVGDHHLGEAHQYAEPVGGNINAEFRRRVFNLTFVCCQSVVVEVRQVGFAEVFYCDR